MIAKKSYREHRSAQDYSKVFTGLLLMSLGFGRRLGRLGSMAVTVAGASKIAEGMTGYSPLADLWRSMDWNGAKARGIDAVKQMIPVRIQVNRNGESGTNDTSGHRTAADAMGATESPETIVPGPSTVNI